MAHLNKDWGDDEAGNRCVSGRGNTGDNTSECETVKLRSGTSGGQKENGRSWEKTLLGNELEKGSEGH